MATHSSILAWEIPWAEKPGRPKTGVAELAMTEHTHVLFGYGSAGGGLRSSTATSTLSVAEGSCPTSRMRQKPGGPHARGAAAKRSYPTSMVRGSGQDCQTATAQEPPRGATPHPRPGAAAGRRYPASKERWLQGCRRV